MELDPNSFCERFSVQSGGRSREDAPILGIRQQPRLRCELESAIVQPGDGTGDGVIVRIVQGPGSSGSLPFHVPVEGELENRHQVQALTGQGRAGYDLGAQPSLLHVHVHR